MRKAGPCEPICRDCAIYFLSVFMPIFRSCGLLHCTKTTWDLMDESSLVLVQCFLWAGGLLFVVTQFQT